MDHPVLSICIPTYNRANLLKETLDSIVSQSRFTGTNDVEIIISDNCSPDNTREVGEEFQQRFPVKIKYSRNDKNIIDGNMEAVLKKGSGDYLKLNNDTLSHLPGSLDKLIEIVKNNIAEKRVLFFLNREAPDSQAANLDEFVQKVSFDCTWIGSFGIWKEDLNQINDFARYADLHLTQVDVLYRVIAKGKGVYINGSHLFEILGVSKKGGYDLLDVFLDNYTFILKEHVPHNVSVKTYHKDNIKLVINFFAPWMARIDVYNDLFYFEARNRWARINKFCGNNPWLLSRFYAKYAYFKVGFRVKKTIKGLKK